MSCCLSIPSRMAESGGPRAGRDPEVAAGARPPLPGAGARGGVWRRQRRGRRGSRSTGRRLPRALLGRRGVRRAGDRGPQLARSTAGRVDMSAAGLLAPAPAGAPPAPEYYPEEDEELESAEDDERSCRGRESDEGRTQPVGWATQGRGGRQCEGGGAARGGRGHLWGLGAPVGAAGRRAGPGSYRDRSRGRGSFEDLYIQFCREGP